VKERTLSASSVSLGVTSIKKGTSQQNPTCYRQPEENFFSCLDLSLKKNTDAVKKLKN
jgi:hypothetical protein